MIDVPTLLVAPNEMSPKGFTPVMQTKSLVRKRRMTDHTVRSCLSRGSGSYSIIMPSKKKLRQCTNWDMRPSKVSWKTTLEDQSNVTPCTYDECSGEESREFKSSMVDESQTWYSVSDECLVRFVFTCQY